MGSHLIFDFDGTLADTFSVFVEILNSLAPKYHFRKANSTEVQELRYRTAREGMSYLGISIFQVPWISRECRIAMNKKIGDVLVFDGIQKMIRDLKDRGHELSILSSNSLDNIQFFLSKYDLVSSFTRIEDRIGLFGKPRALKKYLQKYRLDASSSYFIGDEIRDIESARRSGIKSVSVGWGYNHPDRLLQENPDFLVKTPQELERLFCPSNVPG